MYNLHIIWRSFGMTREKVLKFLEEFNYCYDLTFRYSVSNLSVFHDEKLKKTLSVKYC